MSERMVELQRAALLAGKGSKANSSGGPGGSFYQNGSGPMQPRQTPREAAVSAMQSEDEQMKRFLQRLQHQRDDSRSGEAALGPTVPTALSRRMLQRQGAGYLDSTVAAVASASADLFLATVLQQAVACRDQRLKGAEMDRQVARKRRRHQAQYQEDVDDRRRRNEEKDASREGIHLAAIEAAEALNQKTAAQTPGKGDDADGADATNTGAKPKKKKKAADLLQANGTKLKVTDLSDDESSNNSLDDEEQYYQSYYRNDNNVDANSDDEDDDEMMVLRDLARPLGAWHFHLEGKLSVCETEHAITEHDVIGDMDANENMVDDDGRMDSLPAHDEALPDAIENGGFDDDGGAAAAENPQTKQSSPTKRAASKSPDDKKQGPARKSSGSPLPGPSGGP